MNYNLLDEKWIPVLYRCGKWTRVGIRKALEDAGRIRQITASNPMDNVALLRLLLAVLQWCKPVATQDELERPRGEGASGIRSEWLGELGTKKEPNAVFDLLGNSRRFMQAAPEADNKRPVADLYHELPGDTNVAHLRHIVDYRDGMCPKCVAVGLTRLPIAITVKGASKIAGINGDPPVYFVPVGKTLLHTFLLNWPFPSTRGDKPCWLAGARRRNAAIGVLEGSTWTPRQFRIDDSTFRTGRCLVCGEHTTELTTGLKELNEPNGRQGLSRSDKWRDPHVAYKGRKGWRAEDTEKNIPGASGQWREWLSLLLSSNSPGGISTPDAVRTAACRVGPDVPLDVMIVGFAIRQDKAVECWSHTVIMPGNGAGRRADALRRICLLENKVSSLLDPHVEWKGKKLKRFKERHPLRTARPLTESFRAALADRLPTFERAGLTATTGDITAGAASTDRAVSRIIQEAVASATSGSPLRKLEAEQQASFALQWAIAGIERSEEEAGQEKEAAGSKKNAKAAKGKKTKAPKKKTKSRKVPNRGAQT